MGRIYGTHSNSVLFPGLKSRVTIWIEPTALSYNDINLSSERAQYISKGRSPLSGYPKYKL